jgi:hypothetical protein
LADEVEHLLPTPAARDWKSGESNLMDRNARPLNEVVVNLLPTPRASDGAKGGPNQRGSKGDLARPAAVVQLLPTPTVADSRGTRNATAGRKTDNPNVHLGWTLTDMTHSGRVGAISPPPSTAGKPSPDDPLPGQLTIAIG